jgi:hypothetical protein
MRKRHRKNGGAKTTRSFFAPRAKNCWVRAIPALHSERQCLRDYTLLHPIDLRNRSFCQVFTYVLVSRACLGKRSSEAGGGPEKEIEGKGSFSHEGFEERIGVRAAMCDAGRHEQPCEILDLLDPTSYRGDHLVIVINAALRHNQLVRPACAKRLLFLILSDVCPEPVLVN